MDREKYYLLHKECVRRNPYYIEQYRNLQKMRTQKEVKKENLYLLLYWRLMTNDILPIPEDLSQKERQKKTKLPFKPYIPHKTPDTIYNDANFNFECNIEDLIKKVKAKSLKGLLYLVYIPEENIFPFRPSAIDTRWSKKDIHEAILKEVDEIIKYRKHSGLKQAKPKKRLRIEHGFDYLKVYDMRKAGMKYREIAETLWKGSIGDMERKARLYYKKAKELVENPPLRSQEV